MTRNAASAPRLFHDHAGAGVEARQTGHDQFARPWCRLVVGRDEYLYRAVSSTAADVPTDWRPISVVPRRWLASGTEPSAIIGFSRHIKMSKPAQRDHRGADRPFNDDVVVCPRCQSHTL